ncbi:MAG: methyltransferase [Blastocatellia bacterium]
MAFGLRSPPAPFHLPSLVVGALLGLGFYSVTLVRRSAQSENPWNPTTEIVNRGPFRFTWNPMYLQMVLGCIGFAVILTNMWILLLTPVPSANITRLCRAPPTA